MRSKTLALLVILTSFSLWGSGCSKQEPPPAPVVEAQPTELPELEQNTLYRTNLPEPALPLVKDTSFTETEDDLEEPPPVDPLNPPPRPTD